jgi:hypothetical protein
VYLLRSTTLTGPSVTEAVMLWGNVIPGALSDN